MAMFFPGFSKCAITGRVLGQNDEIAFFPPFSHADPSIQKCSDGIVDFAAVRTRPEFGVLVDVYRALAEEKECIFRSDDGALVGLRFDEVQVIYFPLLLSLNAPEASVRNLCMSNFSAICLSKGQGRFEDYGFGLTYADEQLTVHSCPTKYLPSGADPNLIHRLNRRRSSEVEPFLKFIANVSWSHNAA